MKFLEHICAPNASSSEIVTKLHDEHLTDWDNHIESLIKLKDDKLLVQTVIFLGTNLSCDNDNEKDEDENRRVCEKQVKILVCTCRKEFLELLTARVSAWSISKSKKFELGQDELGKVLVSIHSFCQAVIHKLPYLGKDLLPNLICTGIGVLAASQQLSSQHPTLLKELMGLQQRIAEINETFQSKKGVVKKDGFSEAYERLLHSKEPPQNFRNVQIIPTLEELLEDKIPFLRPNKIKGAYFSPEHYLDVQFRLLREDFVQPLRKTVEHFLENKLKYLKTKSKKKFKTQQQNGSSCIYTGVTFGRVEKSRENENVHFFKLPQETVKKVNWTKSKKLLPGCLVMFTSDCCETAIFATTLAPPFRETKTGIDPRRKELSQGVLRVSIETGVNHVVKNLNYIMFECEAYFEAYRYNLDILQKTRIFKNESRITKFIVEASSLVDIPNYAKRMKKGTRAELVLPFQVSGEPVTVPLSQTQEWPEYLIKSQLGLDDNQYQAYKRALTSELSIIQGPPGTGKTFIGLQILKTLLLNKTGRKNLPNQSLVIPNAPILILCYTNHALDQFLELLLSEIDELDLIRVGGQCKSEILKRHSLPEKRAQMKLPYIKDGKKNFYRQVQSLEKQLSDVLNEVRELENPRGILDFKSLALGLQVLEKLPCSWCKVLGSGDWLGIPEEIVEPVDPELEKMVIKEKAKLGNGNGVENVMERNETWISQKNYYFPGCSSVDCREHAKWLNGRLLNYTPMENDIVYKDMKYQIEACDSRAKLIETIFDMYKNKQLYLTNQDDEESESDNDDESESDDDEVGVELVIEIFNAKPQQDIEKWEMSVRWALYFKLVEIALKFGRKKMKQIEEDLVIPRIKLKEERQYQDGILLRQADVIGMTTTGAAKNHSMLEIAKPQIVVVEEAAEILEAHIVTSLTENCNQLILIGDHFQLRPTTNVYELEKKYHLNVSLFERMILNNINFCALKVFI
ncbi:NFX1-type zinc finger-containing protein 1 [Orchesella cincta]|uniref:NFX1-type zinc finger-containing protein 1 n=1 Tax=Orchesella cincta TaxID=48709 RepID=A0A1D2MC89_ORCCI|nr:NFX1-type zinc finger-containing protein 1 [Orchesella cincta]